MDRKQSIGKILVLVINLIFFIVGQIAIIQMLRVIYSISEIIREMILNLGPGLFDIVIMGGFVLEINEILRTLY